MWGNCSVRSPKMSKWANGSFFWANCSFAHFLQNRAIRWENRWANSQPWIFVILFSIFVHRNFADSDALAIIQHMYCTASTDKLNVCKIKLLKVYYTLLLLYILYMQYMNYLLSGTCASTVQSLHRQKYMYKTRSLFIDQWRRYLKQRQGLIQDSIATGHFRCSALRGNINYVLFVREKQL